jgi:hypothetical protein
MNNLLDIAGHFLYIALSIILLPVFIALDIFLGAWITAKNVKRWSGIVSMKLKKKQPVYHPGFKKSLAFLKAKTISVTANGQ